MLKIRPFDLDSIKPFRKHVFCGGSGRGKTHCMLHVLSHIAPSIDMCLLFCGTETTRDFFRRRQLIPHSHMYETLDLMVVQKALSVQRELREKGKKRSLALVFDDTAACTAGEKAVWKSPVILDLLYNQRHIGIHTFVCIQYMMTLPPDCRTNIDYLVYNQRPLSRKRAALAPMCIRMF